MSAEESDDRYVPDPWPYCLMTNHVHLLLQLNEGVAGLSALMKRLAGRQTRSRNHLENRTGTLWEGRYKVSVIQEETYLLTCLRYIKLNPIRAGMVKAADDYPWSSYQNRREECHHELDFPIEYLQLSSDRDCRNQAYREMMDQGLNND